MNRNHSLQRLGVTRESVRHGKKILELKIAAGVQAARKDVDHRQRDRRLAIAREPVAITEFLLPPLPPVPPRRKLPGSRWLRGSICRAIHRVRSGARLPRPDPPHSCLRARARYGAPHCRRRSVHLCRRSGLGSASRSSTASWVPVDAPEGTCAWPQVRPSTWTCTERVGFPRESRISSARIFEMVIVFQKAPRPIGAARG